MYALNYEANTYLAVTLSPGSTYFQDPATLAAVHPSISHVGQVGPLQDVQLVSVPKRDWDGVKEEVLQSLMGSGGIGRVDVQVAQQRAKRGGDEL